MNKSNPNRIPAVNPRPRPEASGRGGRQSPILISTSRGFTLLEVLISLTLLTIVLGTAYGSFFTAQRALERFDSVSLKYHEVRTALDIIRREMEGIFFKDETFSENKDNRTFFIIEDRDVLGKTTSRLYFTAFSFKGSGVNVKSYQVLEKDGILTLVKAEMPASARFSGEEALIDLLAMSSPIDMVEGIESFTVETFFDNKWIKTWNTREIKSIPDTVRVSIEFDDKGKKVKLTEYARPRVGKKL